MALRNLGFVATWDIGAAGYATQVDALPSVLQSLINGMGGDVTVVGIGKSNTKGNVGNVSRGIIRVIKGTDNADTFKKGDDVAQIVLAPSFLATVNAQLTAVSGFASALISLEYTLQKALAYNPPGLGIKPGGGSSATLSLVSLSSTNPAFSLYKVVAASASGLSTIVMNISNWPSSTFQPWNIRAFMRAPGESFSPIAGGTDINANGDIDAIMRTTVTGDGIAGVDGAWVASSKGTTKSSILTKNAADAGSFDPLWSSAGIDVNNIPAYILSHQRDSDIDDAHFISAQEFDNTGASHAYFGGAGLVPGPVTPGALTGVELEIQFTPPASYSGDVIEIAMFGASTVLA